MPYEQDRSGVWWYVYGSGGREQASVSKCERCGSDYPHRRHGKAQRYCSTKCSDAARSRERTAAPDFAGVVPERWGFEQDEAGQWWYRTKHQRSRAKVRICEGCEREYLAPADAKTRFCSRACRRGPSSARWKGGRRTYPQGYVLVWMPEHPSLAGTQRKYVMEHRLVMEEKLGRHLLPFERVHHKNGKRDDNRLENLELWLSNHPYGQRPEDLATFVVENYRGLVERLL